MPSTQTDPWVHIPLDHLNPAMPLQSSLHNWVNHLNLDSIRTAPLDEDRVLDGLPGISGLLGEVGDMYQDIGGIPHADMESNRAEQYNMDDVGKRLLEVGRDSRDAHNRVLVRISLLGLVSEQAEVPL